MRWVIGEVILKARNTCMHAATPRLLFPNIELVAGSRSRVAMTIFLNFKCFYIFLYETAKELKD